MLFTEVNIQCIQLDLTTINHKCNFTTPVTVIFRLGIEILQFSNHCCKYHSLDTLFFCFNLPIFSGYSISKLEVVVQSSSHS